MKLINRQIYVFSATAVIVAALSACGGGGDAAANLPPPTDTSILIGTLRGPVGAQVVLQNNGADDTTVTVATPVVSSQYNETSFAFAIAPASGAAYAVTLSQIPADQTCAVYKGATGTIPVNSTSVRVGCEHTFDMLSRSTDNSALSYNVYNNDVVIGGNATTGEGRYVAFSSTFPNLASGNSNGYRQIFWRDRQTGQTLLVSANSSGVEGNGSSQEPAISADGQIVAFSSYATNLAGTDANGTARDVYIWSASAPTAGVQLVSKSTASVQGNADSFQPTLSGDGNVVAFATYANNLAGIVSGTTIENVVMRNLTSNITTLVSTAIGTSNGGNFGSSHPSLSEDGTRLAFWSFASNLVSSDTNSLWDIFVYDSTSGTTTLVSYTDGGVGARDGGNESSSRIVTPTISGNGRYVAYATTSTNIVTGDTGLFQDVFVVDTQTQAVVRASVTTGGVQGDADSPVGQGGRVALSYDGAWVAFNTSATNLGATSGNAVMRNISTGETLDVTGQTGYGTSYVSMSRNAAYVAFGTGNQLLDPRFASSGLFARYTGAGRAWWWID